ncbi:MAG: hypothetical protein ACXWLM_10125 [Myxococcales bacterium]
MKNLFRILAALVLLGSAVACGGTADNADETGDESAADMTRVDPSEPITWINMSKTAAAKYSKNAELMNIEGNIGPTDGFTWQFSFQGDGSIWTVVQCDGRSTKVLSHGKREFIMGVMAIDLKEVKVTNARLMKIGAREGLHGRVLHVELSQPLTPKSHPHWTLQQGGDEIMVDAYTGSVAK